MAEKLSKHCWVTPKCGISFAEKHFRNINRDINYKFIMVRCPYNRLVSFYINKVIYQGDPPWSLKEKYEYEVPIPHFGISNTGVSFEEFIKKLRTINVVQAERHLKPQWLGIEKHSFDKIVYMENFKEDIKEVCELLDFDYNKIIERKNNHFVRTDTITEPVYDKSTKWFRENGLPKNYDLYYTKEMRDIVFNLYKQDFDLFKYKR